MTKPEDIDARQKMVSAVTDIKDAAIWLQEAQRVMTPEQREACNASDIEKALMQYYYDIWKKIYDVFDIKY